MTEDLLREVENINWNIGQWQQYTDTFDTSVIDQSIEETIHTTLLGAFIDAMDQLEEYQEGALREHLIDNIQYHRHVIVKNGVVQRIWDIDHAGTPEDLRSGQEAAWALSPKSPSQSSESRSWFWKYVYLGVPPRNWPQMDPDLYGNIIAARLAAWGEKAPYWIFIEYGTAAGYGPGTPYPSFGGRNPIAKTADDAKRIASDMMEGYADTIGDVLSTHIDKVFVESRVVASTIKREVETAWTKTFAWRGRLKQQEYFVKGGGFTGRYRYVE